MKKIAAVLLLLFLIPINIEAQYGYQNGTIITNNNDTIDAIILIDVSYEDKIYYKKTANSEEQEISVDNVKSLKTRYSEFEKIRYTTNPKKNNVDERLMKKLVEGSITLYLYTSINTSAGSSQVAGGTVSYYTPPTLDYVMVKMGESFYIKESKFKEEIIPLISKVPKLVERIQNKELTFENIEEIARTYNKSLNEGSVGTILTPFDYRCSLSEEGLLEYFANHTRYPGNSKENNTIGISIAGLTINSNGDIVALNVINPLDEWIDSEVEKVLRGTKKYWKGCDTINYNQTFYFQFAFLISGDGLESIIESPIKNNPYFFEIMLLTSYAQFEREMPLSSETIAVECNSLLNIKDYDGALMLLNELIRRNPFNKELYQLRINLYTKTNKKNLINSDIQKITNFIPGVSLEELLQE